MPKPVLSPRLQLPAALALGLVSACAFQPIGWWPLMLFAFAGLSFLLSEAAGLRRALGIGWCFGVGQFVLGLNWIATSFTYQAAMPAWLGWLAVVLLSLYLAVYPMIAAGLAWRFGQRSWRARVFALAGAWALTEWLRATIFTGFAWNPVGVIAVGSPVLMDGASVFGTYGMSAFVVMFGAAMGNREQWSAVGEDGAVVPASRLLLLISVGIFLLNVQLSFRDDAPPQGPGGKPIRVVQPNIGQEDKWRAGLDEEAYQKLAGLSRAGGPPRLLMWPEVAIPVPFQAVPDDKRMLPVTLPPAVRAASLIRPGDLLLTGAFALMVDNQGRITGDTNSVMPIDAQGRILGRYDKAHLVPYGEYLPMRPLLSAIGLSQLAPGTGDTLSGPGPRTLDLGGWGKMGVQICYEIIFSGQVVDRDHRPDFLFNPSNDAWFGRWGPPQHLAQARLRAVEEGVPIIRSTPTGISAVIDSEGRLLASIPWRTAGVIDAQLPAPGEPTFFSKHGNVVPLALAFLMLLFAVGIDGRARYRARI